MFQSASGIIPLKCYASQKEMEKRMLRVSKDSDSHRVQKTRASCSSDTCHLHTVRVYVPMLATRYQLFLMLRALCCTPRPESTCFHSRSVPCSWVCTISSLSPVAHHFVPLSRLCRAAHLSDIDASRKTRNCAEFP